VDIYENKIQKGVRSIMMKKTINSTNIMNFLSINDIINDNNIDLLIGQIKEEISMENTNKWEIPRYSGNQINKAGKIIADPFSTPKEREEALVILNNWRAAHAYPLQVICSNLRQKNPDAIVVQRLKRLESITGKIQRFPEMQLYKMQDLGGCRVIVDTIKQVYEAIDKYKSSRIRHILKREYDYIANPKESGYRSYHMVYQFHSESKDTYNKNMFIEIQFRTKLQHMWATAVEMMGIYTKSNLKSSQGDYDILRFFTLVSSLFAIQEKMPICPNTSDWADELISEIKYLDNKNNIISTLSGLNVSINHASNKYNQRDKNLYYIILLNYDKMTVTVKPFKSSNLETATKLYGKIEQGSNINVVLVSASSFETLRLAYPNYFADISFFVTKLRRVIENYDSIKNQHK
jgi:ppGpp synthetase/RelA/SpoT-type nucleotidyltranferase